MRDFDLISLRMFVTVCEEGSLARAAERAHVVSSAISKRLAQLEEQAGTRLMLRRRSGIELTPAGHALLEHARYLLDGSERLRRDMDSFRGGARGQVRLLASNAAITQWLIDDVAAFLQVPGHGEIRVNMEERVSPEILRGVLTGAASLGLCWDAATRGVAGLEGLATRPYRQDRLCVAVPAGHPLAANASLRFAQTLGYEHVSHPPNSAFQILLQRQAGAAGVPLRQRIVVSNFDAALRAVRAGLAIALVPEPVVRQAPAGGFTAIPLDEPWAARQFVLCYRLAPALPTAARMLADALAGAAPDPLRP